MRCITHSIMIAITASGPAFDRHSLQLRAALCVALVHCID
jgi:hypothetical protein